MSVERYKTRNTGNMVDGKMKKRDKTEGWRGGHLIRIITY